MQIYGMFEGLPRKIVALFGLTERICPGGNVNRNCSSSHFVRYVLIGVSIPSHVIFHSKTIPTDPRNIPQVPQNRWFYGFQKINKWLRVWGMFPLISHEQ